MSGVPGALRLLVGSAVAPPVAVLAAVLAYDALWYTGMLSGGAAIDSIDGAVSFGMGVGILAMAMTAVAVPLILWLNARGPLSRGKVLALGIVLGNVPFGVIILGIAAAHPLSETLSGDIGRFWYGAGGFVQRVVIGTACGVSSAAAFWVVAVRSRAGRVDTGA